MLFASFVGPLTTMFCRRPMALGSVLMFLRGRGRRIGSAPWRDEDETPRIRKLAAEAADNGLLAPELAQGISRVKSVKSTGIRVGNWLSQRQAQALLSAPDISTVRGPA